MDDKEPITSPDDPLGAAIQNFALYARGEGSFDELDLKEAIFAWHEADKQRALRQEVEGFDRILADDTIHDEREHLRVLNRHARERLAQLSKEDVSE